jgi:flagellar protein FliO/FliZ
MDLIELFRMLFGLLAVLALIGLCAVGARKAGLAGSAFGAARRLKLVETLALDARRRLAIVSCDGREHLIAFGPAGETLIAADIPAPAAGVPARPAFPIAEAVRRFKDRTRPEAAATPAADAA